MTIPVHPPAWRVLYHAIQQNLQDIEHALLQQTLSSTWSSEDHVQAVQLLKGMQHNWRERRLQLADLTELNRLSSQLDTAPATVVIANTEAIKRRVSSVLTDTAAHLYSQDELPA